MQYDLPRLIHVGNNNWLNASDIFAVSTLKTASMRRSFEEALKNGLVIDFTGRDKTRGIVLTKSGYIVRIPLRPMDVARMLEELDKSSS